MQKGKVPAFLRRFIPPSVAHMRVGKEGERLAVRFLKHEGLHIVARNVRIGRDEIDVIAKDPVDDVLVFLEVKSRSHSDSDFPAMMSAGPTKMRKILRAARRWIADHEYEGGYRIDLLCIEGGKVVHYLREVSWER